MYSDLYKQLIDHFLRSPLPVLVLALTLTSQYNYGGHCQYRMSSLEGAPLDSTGKFLFHCHKLKLSIQMSFMTSSIINYPEQEMLVIMISLKKSCPTLPGLIKRVSPIEKKRFTSAIIFTFFHVLQVESSVVLRPFWIKLTESETHAVMTGGFATVAGTVIAAYIEFGVSYVSAIHADPGHGCFYT